MCLVVEYVDSDECTYSCTVRDGVNWTWIQRLLESGMNAGLK